LFFLTCLAAGPGQAADAKPTSSAPSIAVSNVNLLPIRVVYQQVEGTFLKSPRGVWADRSKGDVYVADTSNDLVAVYDSMGLPVFSFGYNRELKEPVKAVADPTGRIYVLNGIPRAVKIFNYRGEYLNDFPLSGGTKPTNPTALAIDHAGNLYIADATSRQIQVYDSQFRRIREFGRKTNDDSYFNTVQAIAVDADGTVYVADATATPCIQVFSPEGKFVRGWGAHDAGPHNFSLPAGLALDGEGRVIVVDTMRSAITVFTKEGNFLSRHGGQGRQPGAVSYPTDIASNGKEKIYVVERLGSRLQVFEEKAALVRRNAGSPSASNPIREQIQRELGGLLKGMK
jgi:DNA-binding beta-propeller fold protein YncE